MYTIRDYIQRIGSVESFKGQLISELLFDVLNFPKNQRKNLMNFCLESRNWKKKALL